ncbi:hypothetical protein VTL71DRAFT_2188 [Oculimacula yallundae]|uniref:Uncharacterized protein n=1 Tax=Oculimacula yallundae TaxID=86028 RepID=A0ABR4C8X7_9HELO
MCIKGEDENSEVLCFEIDLPINQALQANSKPTCRISLKSDSATRQSFAQFAITTNSSSTSTWTKLKSSNPRREGGPASLQISKKCFGKSDEVIALLRALPYIRQLDCDKPAHGFAHSRWADWQHEAATSTQASTPNIAIPDTATDDEMTIAETLKVMSEGVVWEDIPA